MGAGGAGGAGGARGRALAGLAALAALAVLAGRAAGAGAGRGGWAAGAGEHCEGVPAFDARAFGARGDGVHDDGTAVQAAIDAAAASRVPGACAVVQAGVFLVGGLLLQPEVTLVVDQSAILRASTEGAAYLPQFGRAPANSPGNADCVAGALIGAVGAHNARIVGGGVLDAQAPQYYTGVGVNKTEGEDVGYLPDQLTFRTLSVPKHGDVRVKVLSVSHSENVTVAGVTLTDGHGWTTRFVNCTNLLVSHVDVFGDWRMPNNDGLDPNSCTNVTFEHIDVNVADDAISPKATLKLPDGGYLPMRGLTVRHARLRSRSFAVKIGTEIYGDMEDMLFEDLRVYSSHEGLGIDLRESGNVRNVTFRRVNIDQVYWAGSGEFARQNWMGNAQPIFVSNGKAFGPVRPRGTISGLLFEDVTAVGENGVYISGLPSAPGMERGSIHDVVFRDVRVVVQQLPKNNATNGPHPAHSDRQEFAAAGGAGGEPVDAFFVEHATGVSFEGACTAAFAGSAKPGNAFGACVRFGAGAGEPAPQLAGCVPPR